MERQIEKKSKKIDRFDAELFRLSDGRVNTVEINAFVDSRNRLELVHVRRLSFVDITIYSFSFFSSFQSPLLCICLECHLYLLITLKLQRVKEHKITFSSSSSSHFVCLSFWRIQELARNDNHLPNYDKSFGCSQHFPWNFRFFPLFHLATNAKIVFPFFVNYFYAFRWHFEMQIGSKNNYYEWLIHRLFIIVRLFALIAHASDWSQSKASRRRNKRIDKYESCLCINNCIIRPRKASEMSHTD